MRSRNLRATRSANRTVLPSFVEVLTRIGRPFRLQWPHSLPISSTTGGEVMRQMLMAKAKVGGRQLGDRRTRAGTPVTTTRNPVTGRTVILPGARAEKETNGVARIRGTLEAGKETHGREMQRMRSSSIG